MVDKVDHRDQLLCIHGSKQEVDGEQMKGRWNSMGHLDLACLQCLRWAYMWVRLE